MGRKEDALLVWEQGYEHAVVHSADLKQLLELEELLKVAKEGKSNGRENHAMESESSTVVSESGLLANGNSSQTHESPNYLNDQSILCGESGDSSEVNSKCKDIVAFDGVIKKDGAKEQFGMQMNGNHDVHDKSSNESESSDNSKDKRGKLSIISGNSSDLTQTQLSTKLDIPRKEISDESNKNKKFCVTRISKTKSISVDFRLSRGIAEVLL